MQLLNITKSLLLVFLMTRSNLSMEFEDDSDSVFKAGPVNCTVVDSSESKIIDFAVTFRSDKIKDSEPFGVAQRGMRVPVENDVDLIIFELQGTKSFMVYNPDNQNQYLTVSSLTEGRDVGIEGGVDGFMIYWYNYLTKKQKENKSLIHPSHFKKVFNQKFKGTPVKIVEYRNSFKKFESTISDPMNLISVRDQFFVEVECEIRILDAHVYVGSLDSDDIDYII